MGICKLPSRRMYWGSQTAVPIISESMTKNRFEDMSILHFNDKKVVAESQDGHNRLHKIQPLIDHFKTLADRSFLKHTRPSTK